MEPYLTMKNKIIESIKRAQQNLLFYETIYSQNIKSRNDFMFFIKPELTVKSKTIDIEQILDIIFNQIAAYNLSINNISILSANYLKEYKITEQHYGVINKLSKNVKSNLSEDAKSKFVSTYGKNINDIPVFGGHEFLDKFPLFTSWALDVAWQNKENIKIAPGTYCEDIKVDGEVFYLINGFHPRQISHFTDMGRSIVIFHLAGDIDWKDARQKFVGATNPMKAENESLRNILLTKKEQLGIPEVSQGLNGVHLSAGPIEGLLELVRYCSNFSDQSKIVNYDKFLIGKFLDEKFSNENVKKILLNDNIRVDEKEISIFDFTEEKNSEEAIDILKKYI